MKLVMLKDSEPYFEGDVVEIASEDSADYMIEQGIAEVADRDVPLFSRGVDETQDGVSVQDKDYAARMASAGAKGKAEIAKELKENGGKKFVGGVNPHAPKAAKGKKGKDEDTA